MIYQALVNMYTPKLYYFIKQTLYCTSIYNKEDKCALRYLQGDRTVDIRCAD